MSDLKINNITDRTGGSGPVIAGVSTVSTTGSFVVPVGPTEMRGGRGRAVIAGGNTGTHPSTSNVNAIQYITIATTGNATDFGDLSQTPSDPAGCASATRGLIMGGLTPSVTDKIESVIISSKGGSSDYADLSTGTWGACAVSDGTRAIVAGGRTPSLSIQDAPTLSVMTIATQAGPSKFGELATKGTISQNGLNVTKGACASPTRGIFLGGGSPRTANIDFVNIASLGDGKEFGEAITPVSRITGLSNTTRGIFAGGYLDGSPASVHTDVIQYLTISTLGNTVDFGNLTQARYGIAGSASATRGVFMGGLIVTAPTYLRCNIIDYITISSTGNATDFGDLLVGQAIGSGFSDSHGGLG